jgi:hypothetical protein
VEDLGEGWTNSFGQQAYNSLQRKDSECKIRLVQSLEKLKGDLTGSSNSKSLSDGKVTRTD